MLVNTFGRPLRFRINPAQASDIGAAPDLPEGQPAEAVLADKASVGNDLRDRIAAMNAEAVIPSKRNRDIAIRNDARIYKHRNQIERCFGRFRHVRGSGSRHDRRITRFSGPVNLAAAII